MINLSSRVLAIPAEVLALVPGIEIAAISFAGLLFALACLFLILQFLKGPKPAADAPAVPEATPPPAGRGLRQWLLRWAAVIAALAAVVGVVVAAFKH